MCSYSMIADHFHDKWTQPPYVVPPPRPMDPQPVPNVMPYPIYVPQPLPRPITQDEVDELRELLRKAKEYDKKTNQEDCELEEKKEKLRKLAREYGLEIEFP